MAKKTVNTELKQNKDHLFQKGKSGNPKGKPRGSRHKVTMALEKLLDGEGEALTRKAIELAKNGDLTAIKLCLDRIIPPRKSRPININLPDVKTAEGVAAAQATVVQAVGSGLIVPEEGLALSSILEARRRAIETQEHELRLNELERTAKNGKK